MSQYQYPPFSTVPTVQNVPTAQMLNAYYGGQQYNNPPSQNTPQIFTRQVNSVDEARAAGINAFDLFLFPHFSEGKIYLKYIPSDGNGKTAFRVFNLEPEAQPQQAEPAPEQTAPQVSMEQFQALMQRITDIEGVILDVKQPSPSAPAGGQPKYAGPGAEPAGTAEPDGVSGSHGGA